MKDTKRRLRLGATIAIGVLLGAAALLGGCGSGDSGEAGADVKPYTDKNYGYSFDYPSTWKMQEGTSADVTAGGSAAGSVGVYDPKGTVVDDIYIDMAQVAVYELAITIDESMMPDIETEVAAVLQNLESQDPSIETVSPLSETTVGGLSGFEVTYRFTKEGAATTSTLYFLFAGDREYQLTVQSADETWEANQPVFDAWLASFTIAPAE